MKQLLLVDDNDKYAALLREHFAPLGYEIRHVVNAAEGRKALEEKGMDYYQVVVTDITMETQLAGLSLVRWMHKQGFGGTVVIASTGFDVSAGMFLGKLLLGSYGVHYLIPKTTVLKKDFDFHPARLFSRPVKNFSEAGELAHAG